MSKPLDLDKPLQLRSGEQVLGAMRLPDGRILAAWGSTDHVVADTWDSDGMSTSGRLTKYDLINVPEKRAVWMNVYTPSDGKLYGFGYATKEEADREASSHRIACVRVEYTEGEGL